MSFSSVVPSPAEPLPSECDIEDLLDPSTYESLVRESYAKELKGKKLTLNGHIPRVAKRVELAFSEIGLEFHKTRPTRLFLTKMVTDPASVLSSDALDRFERLFGSVNSAFLKHAARGTKPFA